MQHLELGFIGFGLIGGSIARSVKKNHPELSIKVYTRRQNPHLEKGVEEGIIDELLYSIDGHFSSCDIIFLCAPVLYHYRCGKRQGKYMQGCLRAGARTAVYRRPSYGRVRKDRI